MTMYIRCRRSVRVIGNPFVDHRSGAMLGCNLFLHTLTLYNNNPFVDHRSGAMFGCNLFLHTLTLYTNNETQTH